MNSSNKVEKLNIENGNTIRFEARSANARIHLEGSGNIVAEVSVDGKHYAQIPHEVAFNDGVCIFPFACYIGDKIRISATSITAAMINYNNVKLLERN